MGYTIDDNFIKAMRMELPEEQVLTDESMARHTTFRIGGNADVFVLPASIEELLAVLKLTKRYSVPLTVLGNGSNVLVRDGGIRGAVVSFGKPFSYIEMEGAHIKAGAGAMLGTVSLFAANHALSGLEFAVGIPGSLGGAVFMNAGAYDGEMSQVISEVTAVTPEGEIRRYRSKEMEFSYRHSVFQQNGNIICEIELSLQEGKTAAIQKKMAEFETFIMNAVGTMSIDLQNRVIEMKHDWIQRFTEYRDQELTTIRNFIKENKEFFGDDPDLLKQMNSDCLGMLSSTINGCNERIAELGESIKALSGNINDISSATHTALMEQVANFKQISTIQQNAIAANNNIISRG